MSDKTAAGVAKIRHIETLAPENLRIIDDPYAEYFYLGSSVVWLMGHSACVWLSDMMVPGAHEMLIARTRFIDDLVRKEVEQGVRQVVMLGAGYDMRGARLGLGDAGVKVFEVDQPAVQSRKKEKVATIPNLSNPVHFVPVDFSCQRVNEELAGHAPGYDPKAKTLIILEGVSQYIPGDAVATTVKAMDSICGPGSSFFLSYVDERINREPEKLGNPQAVHKIMAMAGSVGEPWINFYSQSAIPGFFESCSSFRVVSDVSTDDISRTSFPAARQLPAKKLMTAERYAVARK